MTVPPPTVIERNDADHAVLRDAVANADETALRNALNQGVNPNVADANGWTALMHACNAPNVREHRHRPVVIVLLTAGACATTNVPGPSGGFSPLSLAVERRQDDLVPLLVEHGADARPFLDGGEQAMLVRDDSTRQVLRQAWIERERAELAAVTSPQPDGASVDARCGHRRPRL